MSTGAWNESRALMCTVATDADVDPDRLSFIRRYMWSAARSLTSLFLLSSWPALCRRTTAEICRANPRSSNADV